MEKKAVFFVDAVLSGKLLSDMAHFSRTFALHCCSSKLRALQSHA